MKTIQRREEKSFRADLTISRKEKEQSDSERVKRLKECGRLRGFGEPNRRKHEIR